MSENEEFKMETACGFCGKPFEPHPDSFWETGVEVQIPPEDEFDGEWTKESEAGEHMPETLELDRDTMRELVKAKPGDYITTGAMAVCDQCAAKPVEDLSL